MKPSITTRLGAMFAVTVVAAFAIIGMTLYGVLDTELKRHQDAELRSKLQAVEYTIDRIGGDPARWGRMRERLDASTPPDGSIRVWILSGDPQYHYGRDVDQFEQIRQDASGLGSLVLTTSGQTFRTRTVHVAAFAERPPVRLIVGIDEAPFAHTLRTFLIALTALAVASLVLVTVLGWWIARVGLRPLELLSRQAQALTPKTLSQRLSTDALPVELSSLATAFNGALDRLEDSFAQLEAFTADVAHELRTPLANMIGGAQVALSRPRSTAELEEVLHSNLEELDRLRSIINDMLFLARADQGEAATGLVETAVAEEIAKTIDFYEPLLDESGMTAGVDGPLDTRATINVALFRRALSNLLQNAIQHSGRGARVGVRIEPLAGAVWIRVSNPGTPIAAEHLPRLFARFYRVDQARQGGPDHHGFGLGLAIVKAVASMHGGSVEADSRDGVTTISFSVPHQV